MTHRPDATIEPHAARTVTALLAERAGPSRSEPVQWAEAAQGQWAPVTWSDLRSKVCAIAHGMRALGLEPGERVAVMAAGCPEWDQVHLGVLGARGVLVGLDTHASAAQLDAMMALARPRVLVVDDPTVPSRLGTDALGMLRAVVLVSANLGPGAAPAARTLSLAQLVDIGRHGAIDAWDEAREDDPAWIIFTSGTTGLPKGLVYRHRQVLLAIDAILASFDDIAEGARLASWLPLSNPFQRIINLCGLARGAQTFYVTDPREVMQHLRRIRPQVFIGVPRFYEKLYAGILSELERTGPVRARVARWAMDIGVRQAALRRAGETPSMGLRLAHRAADRLVLRRIRAAFGSDLRYLVSGSAAMPSWLLERLHGVGLLVLEAYGLSECIVPVAANRAGAWRFGSVGRPMAGNSVRLASDGELLLKSEGVFDGYLGEADTSGMIDGQGWLATGDFAEIDGDGFIHLIGRKSEVFKTSTGRRVAPSAVEAMLRAVPGVENAAVFGADRQSLLGVVSLANEAKTSAAALQAGLRQALLALPDYLRPAGLVVSYRPFTMEAGEVTGNLKLRRHGVRDNFAAALGALAALVDSPKAGQLRGVHGFDPGAVELIVL